MVRIALVIVSGLSMSGCCAYGGPGCYDPALDGICAGQVPLGESIATLSYFDDTGAHPSEYERARAVPAEVLEARRGSSTGELILVGRQLGHATIIVGGADGFDDDDEFQYSVRVVTEVDEAACAETGPWLDPAP